MTGREQLGWMIPAVRRMIGDMRKRIFLEKEGRGIAPRAFRVSAFRFAYWPSVAAQTLTVSALRSQVTLAAPVGTFSLSSLASC